MTFTNHRGQVAFELVVVLAVVLFLSASVMLDFFNEATASLAAGYTKNLIESQIGFMQTENKECIGTYMESFNITDNYFNIMIRTKSKNCIPDDGKATYEVEKALCGGKPNENNVIECGASKFYVMLEWKEVQ